MTVDYENISKNHLKLIRIFSILNLAIIIKLSVLKKYKFH